ncbi:MAG: deoxyguanosinetriphosphate triphosphohydrolase [Clostridia bacterium]|nr:deoxyguanosinetriphosphate triphosphohydrolase [Clostridia bacterium]
MLPREFTEQTEAMVLCAEAARSAETKGRARPEEDDPLRTPYQRDRDRVIHCKSFRRLKHKTQVFLSPEGDHYRTRLTHTLEVSQIARTIARALRLNEDLTEAIALAHDLGHTPFGHAGERVLNTLCDGGFRHYEQSLRVVDKLEKERKGLNLTWEVRNGIVCHTTGTEAATKEGKIIRWADRIAYINHDIDDAVRAGAIREEDIPREICEVLGYTKTQRITKLVTSVVNNSPGDTVGMDAETKQAFDDIHDFMWNSVYKNPYAKKEEAKVPLLIEALFEHYRKMDNLPEDLRQIAEEDGCDRAACDYIAGMTDRFAVATYEHLFIPHAWELHF